MQHLAFLDQKPWHQIFLDLHKVYNTMDRKKTLKILADYGVCPLLRDSAGVCILHRWHLGWGNKPSAGMMIVWVGWRIRK